MRWLKVCTRPHRSLDGFPIDLHPCLEPSLQAML